MSKTAAGVLLGTPCEGPLSPPAPPSRSRLPPRPALPERGGPGVGGARHIGERMDGRAGNGPRLGRGGGGPSSPGADEVRPPVRIDDGGSAKIGNYRRPRGLKVCGCQRKRAG